MGSWRVGSGMTGVAVVSSWGCVASGRGVEAKGPPVSGAPRVDAGGEVGSGCAASGPGFGRRSNGPASYPHSPCWKTNRSSFSGFSTLPLKSTSIRRIFGSDTASGFFMHYSKSQALVTTSPTNSTESKNFRETPCHFVLSASAWIRPSSAAAARASASSSLRFLQPPAPVCQLGLYVCIFLEQPGNPGPQFFHLPDLWERPDRWNDPVRSHPQLGADLLQCLLHGFILNPGLPDVPCHIDEGFLHPLPTFLRSRSLQLGIRSTGKLLRFWWIRT